MKLLNNFREYLFQIHINFNFRKILGARGFIGSSNLLIISSGKWANSIRRAPGSPAAFQASFAIQVSVLFQKQFDYIIITTIYFENVTQRSDVCPISIARLIYY